MLVVTVAHAEDSVIDREGWWGNCTILHCEVTSLEVTDSAPVGCCSQFPLCF